jgi:ubiquinone/menaquinone biosynthesis C-methylase UbiE
MRFYDEIGWQAAENDGFQDAKRFEDLRPVSREYIHRCHMRINNHIPRRGTYLLDVASGPVQYREYLTYSEGYGRRICADISIAALKAAKKKLGDRGIYIQCDVTQLPLKNASVDGFVSLHTIYHVPEEKQVAAFRELERVLMHERTGVVVYSWGAHCLTKLLTGYTPKQLLRSVLPNFLVDWLKKVFGAQTPTSTSGHPSVLSTTNKEPELYYHAHDYTWFQREIASTTDWDIRVWRSVSVPFLQRYVHTELLGRLLLSVLFRIEDAFPRLFGRFGQFPMMVYRKTKPNH